MRIAHFEDLAIAPVRPAVAPDRYAAWGKRALDIVVVLAMLPIALPIVLLSGGLMSAAGGGGFFRQMRVGKDGRAFGCWKVRTMVRDADAVLLRLIASDPAVAAEWRHTQKLERDPRITRLGHLLRKTSLDELPQLWNVLVGDMSLIGPRPFTLAQQSLYDGLPAASAYYSLRPGISGLWQVECRNDAGFDARARYDHDYAQTLSLRGDLRIIGRTIRAVLGATGK